jgi:hypothetical protein
MPPVCKPFSKIFEQNQGKTDGMGLINEQIDKGYRCSVTPAEQAVTPLMFPAKQRDLYRGYFAPLKRV